jgi:predicted nuclease of predicted toxin-antitoxin system
LKLLVDVNLSPKWIGFLRAAGIDAIHWSSLGPGDTLDVEIMAFAVQEGFCVLTNDLDFGIMLSRTNAKEPSVIQLRLKDLRPETSGAVVIAAVLENISQIEWGVLLTISLDRNRITLLPMNRTPGVALTS